MLTLLASLGGLLSSFIPQVFDVYKDKRDKKHELVILEKQVEAQKLGAAQRLEEITIQSNTTETVELMKTYNVGIKWVDALNGTVRPVVAYGFFLLFATIKIMIFLSLPETFTVEQIQQVLWQEEDQAIFAAVISFYFGQRSMNKAMKK
jgi:hypothetical protein